MSLRLIEGDSRGQYFSQLGEQDFFPYEQIIKSGEEGPMLAPFYTSLYNGPPYDVVTRNMNVLGTLENPVRYSLPVPTTQVWSVARLIFLMRDNGEFESGGWGSQAIAGPLPNGMRLGITIDGQDIDFTPIPWTTHADLAGVAYDLSYQNWGKGDNFLTMRLTITKAGTRLRLDGTRGDTFWCDVRDDLTYITEQRCMAQGIIEGVYL